MSDNIALNYNYVMWATKNDKYIRIGFFGGECEDFMIESFGEDADSFFNNIIENINGGK